MLRSKGFVAATLALAMISGCQSPPKPEDMARTSLQTAPADLQLLCAHAVAGAAQVDSTKVLPTSSRALDAASYSVDLDAGGRKFNCIVDTAGSVKSVTPAG
ncbi:MAG TPA: hypothetical protein VGO04_10265 [Ensifer sp.]|jgi:hypothetical protein|uniref:hypothetical protein n=1 Tax=Ensifer sp. TaxID=1872086 RepID=UPI002E10AB3C|nr:hypothetical protein [Ensifer sp.]